MRGLLCAALVGLLDRCLCLQTPTASTTTKGVQLVTESAAIDSSFTYTGVTSARYATSLHTPLTFPAPFAPEFAKVSTLLPTNISYTDYKLEPSQKDGPNGKYGQSAFAELWANISYTSSPPFTTIRNPGTMSGKELIFPPALYTSSEKSNLKLPATFIWGVSGSAWQIEGGLQVDGRGPSIMDTVGAIQSNDNQSDANIADMGYFLYREDIARLAAIGIPYYSFSISWTRVVPFGIAGSPINTKGLEHYDDVINTCLEYGITPLVTLNHFDFPLSQMDDLQTLPEHFLYYAKQVMTRYADRIPFWFTFNEPNVGVEYLFNGWNDLTSIMAAHAEVYHWYKTQLKGTGQISMKFANNLAVPLDISNATHIQAALRYQDFILGIMGNPLFLGQQIPADALATANLNLTALTKGQISRFHGTMDFWAFDPYVAQFASPAPEGIANCAANPSSSAWPYCVITSNIQADGWAMGDMSNAYAAIAPQYVRQQLSYVWETFKPSGILIAEFGFNPIADHRRPVDAQRQDLERTLYYQGFLSEMLKSIHLDGVNVIGTLAWSYVDNNEWGSYENQYGMQTVNRTDGKFGRRFKRSIFDYVDFFHQHIAGG
ncbi:beta-glucosidase [Penicillium manginii]|jgi:beta-glucosidase/6-phospho-beta-glucosidase/beta-galactosidase|uniref:beta-glucosidase n=1 Tax=Penicillium manginii TaxID=203109 RepID=UPI0025474901|nr:beta-glucosidase [Penicillium manginii]KAJ5754494.1 beta-glucosidase [Penicillium manginii]